MCPHMAMYVSSCILFGSNPHTILYAIHVSSYRYVRVLMHTIWKQSSYYTICYTCALISLCTCPHAYYLEAAAETAALHREQRQTHAEHGSRQAQGASRGGRQHAQTRRCVAAAAGTASVCVSICTFVLEKQANPARGGRQQAQTRRCCAAVAGTASVCVSICTFVLVTRRSPARSNLALLATAAGFAVYVCCYIQLCKLQENNWARRRRRGRCTSAIYTAMCTAVS